VTRLSASLLLVPQCDSDLGRDGLLVASEAGAMQSSVHGASPKLATGCLPGRALRASRLLRGEARWSVESDFDGDTPDKVVDAVLLVEGLDPATVDRHQRAQNKDRRC
jgi:hypothetical protein